MSKKVKFLAFLAVSILMCSGLTTCTDDTLSPKRNHPRDLSPAEQELVSSYNAFGLTLFREIIKASGDSNVFISPVSVTMALGMTLNGAAGTTEEAMKSALEFSNLTMREINRSYRSLMDLLVNLDPEVRFQIANSIWYRLDEPIEQAFLDTCQTYFNAQVASLDFSSPDAAATINGWVSDNTGGKITQIVDNPVDPWTVMFLINAIYFKGTWTYQFDPKYTKDEFFNRPDGSEVMCKMMAQGGKYNYFENERFQAVDLPYAGGWFTMTALLPKPEQDLKALVSELDQATWSMWLAGFSLDSGLVFLPRFELDCDLLMNDVLGALGMSVAFDQDLADFTRMRATGGLFISRVKHKTYVKVDEEGTEAAAATSVEMGEVSVPDYFTMRMDRPFLFLIREKHSGTILFVGKVTDPTA